MSAADSYTGYVKETPTSPVSLPPDYKRSLLSYLQYSLGVPNDDTFNEILLTALRISSWKDDIKTMSPQAAGKHLISEASIYYKGMEALFDGKKDPDINLCPALRKALEVKSFFSRNMESFQHCSDWAIINTAEEGSMSFDSRFKVYRKETDKDFRILYQSVLESLSPATMVYLYVLNKVGKVENETLSWLIQDRLDNIASRKTRACAPKKERSHNEPISSLLGWFEDKRSKKVNEARGKIKRRFDGQSFNVQKRILRSFLKGGLSDVAWAAHRLKENWIPSVETAVNDACLRTGEESVSKLAVRNSSYRFVAQHIEFLADHAGYDQVCLRMDTENGNYQIDESRLSVPDYFYVMAKLGRNVEKALMEKRFFSFFLGLEPKDVGSASFELAVRNKKVGLIIWAAGRLGMTETLMKLHSFEAQARKEAGDKDDIYYRDNFLYHFKRIIMCKEHNEKERQHLIAMLYPEGNHSFLLGEHDEPETPEEDLPAAFPKSVQDIIDDVLNQDNYTGREIVKRLSQKKISMIMDCSPKPDQAVKAQWLSFVAKKYWGMPRLCDILSRATVTEGAYYFIVNIVLTIQIDSQKEWIKRKVERDLKTSFIEASGRAFVFIDYQYEGDQVIDYSSLLLTDF